MGDCDKYFMAKALYEARRALEEDLIPVGAVIVRDEKVVAAGSRSRRPPSSLAHAEVIALEAALSPHETGQDMTAYVTLEPCIMCFGMLVHARVSRIVFALEDPYGGATRWPMDVMPLRNQTHRPRVTAGVLRRESACLLFDYFQVTTEPCWRSPLNPLVALCSRVGKAREFRLVDHQPASKDGCSP